MTTEQQTPERQAVRVGGLRLTYLEWGAGEQVIVLLHGITSSARGWWRVAPALAALGYHVFALDLPGHGESQETTDHRIPALAELVYMAIDMLGLHNVTVIGHSWGGGIALTLASSVGKGMVARVVLIDPTILMDPVRGVERMPYFMDGVGEPPEVTMPKFRARNPGWQEGDVVAKAEALVQCRPEAVKGLFTAIGAWNLAENLGQVEVPLLMLIADPQYTVVPPEIREHAEQLVRPGSGRAIVVPGTDHNMYRAGYEPTMAVLTGWLQA